MEHEPSSILATAEVIHWIALVVMAAVYSLRLRWLFSFKLARDRSAPGNPARSDGKRGARHSLLNVLMPWGMESTRKNFGFYLTFVLFHLGVVAGITLAFVSTVAVGFLKIPAVFVIFELLLIGAFLIGVYRILRRLLRPVMRLISTPDDFFSLAMLTVWFALGAVTEAHIYGMAAFANELILVAYLLLTSFFLLYVPFSKISHYLYYPFTRIWIGRALGHRGSYPYSRG
jgi:nitrate reductase gamma subunit